MVAGSLHNLLNKNLSSTQSGAFLLPVSGEMGWQTISKL
ncbi:Uncharacterised protein [Acinetobacter nosocomialis]|nr:Uncharacterised protein [Acinetobacter nosocomialis]